MRAFKFDPNVHAESERIGDVIAERPLKGRSAIGGDRS